MCLRMFTIPKLPVRVSNGFYNYDGIVRMIKLVGAIARAKETTSSGDETDNADVFPVPRGSNKSVCVCVV